MLSKFLRRPKFDHPRREKETPRFIYVGAATTVTAMALATPPAREISSIAENAGRVPLSSPALARRAAPAPCCAAMALHSRDNVRNALNDDVYASTQLGTAMPKYEIPRGTSTAPRTPTLSFATS